MQRPSHDDQPSVRRALETWFLSLPFWSPASEDGTCSWCLKSDYRMAMPDDVPLGLLHELVLLIECEVRRGVEGRDDLSRLLEDDDQDRLAAIKLAWRDMLTLGLIMERPAVERALDVHIRPVIEHWVDGQLAGIDASGEPD